MAVWEAKRKTKILSRISCNQTQPTNHHPIDLVRPTTANCCDRTNDQPATNPLANAEKHRKNHSQLPMSTAKSWTFSILFVWTTTTMPFTRFVVHWEYRSTAANGLKGGDDIAIHCTHLVRISCIPKGNWQTAKEMDQEQNTAQPHTTSHSCSLVHVWWKSFRFLLLRLFLLVFMIIFARMYGPFDHLGIQQIFRVGSSGLNSCKNTHTQTSKRMQSFYRRLNWYKHVVDAVTMYSSPYSYVVCVPCTWTIIDSSKCLLKTIKRAISRAFFGRWAVWMLCS